MKRRLADAKQWWMEIDRRERLLVSAAAITSVAMVWIYVLTTRSHPLTADEIQYDEMARLWADGKFWWGTTPFDQPHPTAWKSPLYPAFLGIVYEIFGENPLRAALVQAPLAAVTVVLTWLLGRRLFGSTVAIVAAWIVALFPLAFEYHGILFPETLAIPLTIGSVLAFAGREPTVRVALASGGLIGLCVLARPTSVFLLVAFVVAMLLAVPFRQAARFSAIGIAAAVLVVMPWTIRNAIEFDGFIPVSVQDAAAYGTFNPETAADTENRWAWRAILQDPPDVIADPPPGLTEAEFRSELQSVAREYIADHPLSVPKAMFWNGVIRFWDLRRPADAVEEADFQGRSRSVRWVGLGMYWLMLPVAVAGLWKLRRRPELFWPTVATLASLLVLFATIAGTRYRAPVEPLIVLLAASMLPAGLRILDRDDEGEGGDLETAGGPEARAVTPP